jgi:plasmid stabilization system protein ParE
MKRALQRTLAQRDIAAAFEHYLSAAGPDTAPDFVHEIDACMQRIERFPEAGSLRYADMLDAGRIALRGCCTVSPPDVLFRAAGFCGHRSRAASTPRRYGNIDRVATVCPV